MKSLKREIEVAVSLGGTVSFYLNTMEANLPLILRITHKHGGEHGLEYNLSDDLQHESTLSDDERLASIVAWVGSRLFGRDKWLEAERSNDGPSSS